jgi:hypothetical protein
MEEAYLSSNLRMMPRFTSRKNRLILLLQAGGGIKQETLSLEEEWLFLRTPLVTKLFLY